MKSSPVDLENLLSVYRNNQREIYENGTFHNIYPRVTTDTSRIEEQAKQHLSLKSYQYCKYQWKLVRCSNDLS